MEMMRVFYNSPAVLSNGSDEIFARDIEGCISDNPVCRGAICLSRTALCRAMAWRPKSFSTEYGRQCIWLEDIYIKAEYRGLGIGSQFIDYITKRNTRMLCCGWKWKKKTPALCMCTKRAGLSFLSIKMKKVRATGISGFYGE